MCKCSEQVIVNMCKTCCPVSDVARQMNYYSLEGSKKCSLSFQTEYHLTVLVSRIIKQPSLIMHG